MTKLETIRAACIAANPEIVELKLGCEVIEKMSKDHLLIVGSYRKAKSTLYEIYNPKSGSLYQSPVMAHEIIGRPIRLTDVLLAIGKKAEIMNGLHIHSRIDLQTGKQEGALSLSKKGSLEVGFYNLLKDDLTLQSAETIDFLYNLIK